MHIQLHSVDHSEPVAEPYPKDPSEQTTEGETKQDTREVAIELGKEELDKLIAQLEGAKGVRARFAPPSRGALCSFSFPRENLWQCMSCMSPWNACTGVGGTHCYTPLVLVFLLLICLEGLLASSDELTLLAVSQHSTGTRQCEAVCLKSTKHPQRKAIMAVPAQKSNMFAKKAKSYKDEGNMHFTKKQTKEALIAYEKALQVGGGGGGGASSTPTRKAPPTRVSKFDFRKKEYWTVFST